VIAGHRQRAQSAIELALLVPGLLLGLFVLAAIGLVARADGEVAGVAVEAARAGALVPSVGDVEPSALLRARAVATSYSMHLDQLQVAVDPSNFRRGGEVRVLVSYDLPLASLPLVGWGTVQLHHEAAEPVDTFRSQR
jgi:Flp pilus assembly protein TadG